MSNVKRAVKKITKPNGTFYFSECVIMVLLAISCLGLTGMAIEDNYEFGLVVVEILNVLFMAIGVNLITEGFLLGAKSVSVLPVKREDAAKILIDRILRFSVIPLCTEVFFSLLLHSDINSNHSVAAFDSVTHLLALMSISVVFTFIFVWLSALYAISVKENDLVTKILKYGGYYVPAAILAALKGHLWFVTVLAEKMSAPAVSVCILSAFVCAALHFVTVRKKFAEIFRF